MCGLQAKKSKEDLKEVTNKVYFDVEIDGKPAGISVFPLLQLLCCVYLFLLLDMIQSKVR